MTYLLDGNVLVALADRNHEFHHRCVNWFASIDRFATCPLTEGTLLRLHMMHGLDKTPETAWRVLANFHAHPKHIFWTGNFSYTEISPSRLTGHRQITDSWLAELAKRQDGKLATLDEPLSALWPDSTLLIPY